MEEKYPQANQDSDFISDSEESTNLKLKAEQDSTQKNISSKDKSQDNILNLN